VRCHGTLLLVEGVGVLLSGPSGIGKSECALDLLRRGHRLVADDVVQIARTESGGLEGSAPERIRHHLEIRGLGIVSAKDLFGQAAVGERGPVDLLCRLQAPGEETSYERVGIARASEELAGVSLPRVILPARPAGSIATLVEVAARDHLLRARGLSAAGRLDRRIRDEMGAS